MKKFLALAALAALAAGALVFSRSRRRSAPADPWAAHSDTV